MIRIAEFGRLDGRDVPVITLSNGDAAVELLPFGAAVRALRVRDRAGNWVDVCLGYDTLEEYRDNDGCLGGVVGRCANRIGGARFTLDGKEYRVTANAGENQLHGGAVGFYKKLWDWRCDERSVTFTYVSPDGEEGYPGELTTTVTYTLDGAALVIAYQAESTAPTPVNLTNHAYFNLAGQDGGMVTDHVLTIHAGEFTPTGAGHVPTGELAAVAGTEKDLRTPTVLTEERLRRVIPAGGFGYDFNYDIRGVEGPAAELYCPRTGIAMTLTTTMEGVQCYSSGSLTERRGKNGAVYGFGHAVCLETQHFPDAVNHPAFPDSVVRPGTPFRSETTYRFSVK